MGFRGEMHDDIRLKIREDPVHCRLVAAVSLDEGRTLAGDRFDAVNDLRGAVVKIVDDDDLQPRIEQRNGRMAADEPGAAGQKNGHKKPS